MNVHICFSLLLAVPPFQDLFNDYSCSCQPGYFGRNCEMEIDECLPRPCENGGTCTDFVNGYRCNCSTDFEVWYMHYTAIFLIITMHCMHLFQGVNCDVDMNMCRSNPCLNGATCDNAPNGYSCMCAPGYTGFNCMNDTNECISDPCVHGTCAVSLHHAALSHECMSCNSMNFFYHCIGLAQQLQLHM